jgi:predicted PurR-regulated permease PerM
MELSSTSPSVVPFLAGTETGDAQQLQQDAARDLRPRSSRAMIFLACMAAIAALYMARDVAIPVTLAILLALLLRPIMRRLRKLHWPDTLSSFVIVAIVALIFVGGMMSVAQQGQAWLAEAPRMVHSVSKMLPQNYGPIGDFTKAMNAVWGMGQSETTAVPVPVVVHSGEAAFTVLGASGQFLGAALIVFVLAFFLLAFSDTLLNQAVESRPSFAQKRHVVSLLQNVESGISQYLATITIINICLGAVTGVSLWLLGLPNPMLWGVVAMTLNYVPHVGAFICMVLLFLVGAVARESLWFGAGTAALFVAITSAESYFITPLALSKSLQLSPLAVILSILFWGWLWGIAGGLMAAPLLAVMKIVCDQFESLRPWGVLLSADTRRSAPLPSASTIASESTALPTSA